MAISHVNMSCCTFRDFFFVSSGAKFRPLSQWDLGDFFPNLKKKIPIVNFSHFLVFLFSHHTYTIYMVTHLFSFNLMAIVCVIANLFLNSPKMPLLLFRKIPNLVVYRPNFPNLNGPKAPSQNCKKKSLTFVFH